MIYLFETINKHELHPTKYQFDAIDSFSAICQVVERENIRIDNFTSCQNKLDLNDSVLIGHGILRKVSQ